MLKSKWILNDNDPANTGKQEALQREKKAYVLNKMYMYMVDAGSMVAKLVVF